MYSRGCLSYDLIKKTIGLVNIFCNAIYIYYLKLPYSQYPPLSSRLTNLLKIFDRTTWMLTFLSIFVVHNTFRLLCYIAKKMGYISLEEEITLWPFRYINNFDNFYPIFTLPLHFFRVDIPVDSLASDYIQSEKQRKHNNYLKIRKTAKRGKKNFFSQFIY